MELLLVDNKYQSIIGCLHYAFMDCISKHAPIQGVYCYILTPCMDVDTFIKFCHPSVEEDQSMKKIEQRTSYGAVDKP